MNKPLLPILTILFSLFYININLAQDASGEIMFHLGETPYDLRKFNYYFLKNSDKPVPDSAKQKVMEYLNLYVNFRLKVEEAIALGKDKESAFIQEFGEYKKQLAEPYLMQTKVKDEMVFQVYERMKLEVSASHILIKSDKNSSPEDTLKAYNKALSIKKRIAQGESFGELAKETSEDPSARQNQGNLGYFSSLQMVFPFENAVYENNIGDVVGPVKTRFGYHIILVNDKRKTNDKILLAHIMIRSTPNSISMKAAGKKAQEVYNNLQEGKSWKEQCELYTDDIRSKSKGGELNWFGTGNLVSEFEAIAFSLTERGQISKPVQTRFGWHIIKLIDKKGMASFEEMKADLESRISRNGRFKLKKSTTLRNLKKIQQFELNSSTKEMAFQAFDSSLLKAAWKPGADNSINSKTIFSTNATNYSVKQFWSFVQKTQKKRNLTSLEDYVDQLYNQFEESSIFDEELKNVESNNYDYQMILDEYRSGILLFNLMEEKVWNKAVQDSLGLEEYYKKHKKEYRLAEHAVIRKFVSSDSTVLEKVSLQLSMSNSELDSILNTEEPLTLRAFDEKLERDKNTFVSSHWKPGSYIEKGEEYFTLWNIVEVRPNGFKNLNKIKGLVISDYQNELERLWLRDLKRKFPIKLNKSVVKNFIAELEK